MAPCLTCKSIQTDRNREPEQLLILERSIKSARINKSYTLLVLLLVFCVVSKLA